MFPEAGSMDVFYVCARMWETAHSEVVELYVLSQLYWKVFKDWLDNTNKAQSKE